MWNEIERKFLIKNMLKLSNLESIDYERYFLYNIGNVEIRIQKKWGIYEFERKETQNILSAKKYKYEITKEEFDKLKRQTLKWIFRKSYKVSEDPKITIKIYSDRFEWLSRAEIEFSNQHSAENFKPLDWFGEEITESDLWRDSKLICLSEEEFKSLI